MQAKKIFLAPAASFLDSPKLVLPLVLNLVPQLAFLLLAGVFIAANPEVLAPGALDALLSNGLLPALQALAPFIVLGLLIALASVLVGTFTALSYASIGRQLHEGKKASLSTAFAFAKREYWRYLKAIALASIIFLAVATVLALVSYAVLSAIASALANNFAAQVAVSAVALVASVLFLVSAGLVYFVFPGVVGLGNAGGFTALKSAAGFCKNNFVPVVISLAVVLLVSYAFGLAGAALSNGIPFLGFVLAQLVYLPVNAWALLVPVMLSLEKK